MLSTLTGRLLRVAGAICVGAAAAAVVVAEPGRADYVVCPTPDNCYVKVGTPPKDPGNKGGGGGGDEEPSLCDWHLMEPQPPAGDPLWEGHAPGDGAVFTRTCRGGFERGVTFHTFYQWFPNAPTVTPGQLAQEAVKKLPIGKPTVGIAPDPAGAGLVGLPVWLWLGDAPNSWGSVTANAAVPGLSVTATATAQKVEWSMGDGRVVTCANRGTKYEASYGNQLSPTCGHRYERSSRGEPSGRYTITATVTWQVTWAGGGQTGSLTLTAVSEPVAVRIDELQVVTG